MRIAIISINYAPEPVGIAVYTTGLARYLARRGHAVRVHTGFAWYPSWRQAATDRHVAFRADVEAGVSLWRSWLHVPRRVTTFTRMLHEASFVLSATIAWLVAPRTDLVIVVMPPLLLALPVVEFARLRGSRVILHVQDLQPDAAIALGLLRPSRFTELLLAIERFVYRRADRVSSISEAMLERIGAKGVAASRRILLRNWASDLAWPQAGSSGSLRAAWQLGERLVVLYAGNLGRKQGLDMLIDAAECLRDVPDIVLVIVGEGSESSHLQARIAASELGNVVLQPLQPSEGLPELLLTADIHVIPQRAGVTDIVLPSKLGNILASARPVIVSALASSELATIVATRACGVVVPPGEGAALAAAIIRLRDDRPGRVRMGERGHETATTLFASQGILAAFAEQIEDLVSELPSSRLLRRGASGPRSARGS